MHKILIVDDEEDVLFLLKTYLSAKGYNIKTTLSCEHGLETFYAFKPDLVLLDVNVGDADGRIMCRTIKSQAEYDHIPVILISANREMLFTFAEFKATSTIEKPFSLPKLLQTVELYLTP